MFENGMVEVLNISRFYHVFAQKWQKFWWIKAENQFVYFGDVIQKYYYTMSVNFNVKSAKHFKMVAIW